MKKLFKKLTALAMAAVMMVGVGAAALASDNCRFKQASGSEIHGNVGYDLVASCDYDASTKQATVTLGEANYGTMSGRITAIQTADGDDVEINNNVAVLDMSAAQNGCIELTVTLTMQGSSMPAGNVMDVLFYCEDAA